LRGETGVGVKLWTGVGEALYMKYDEFTKLGPLQQQDLAVEQRALFCFQTASGEALGAALGPSSNAARFRGKPFAFGSGTREARVVALLGEASRASGVRLSNLVDEIRYVQGSSYFDVVGNTRVLAIGSDAFGKTRAGQLIEGAHEIAHAQVFERLVSQQGFGNAVNDYFGAARGFGTWLYAREEVLVERIALGRVRRYLGGLTPQQEAASIRYIKTWRPVWLSP
jgi:hypothetical protein